MDFEVIVLGVGDAFSGLVGADMYSLTTLAIIAEGA
jgi:hypothetical protein